MDTTSTLIIIAMFIMAIVFIGIGIYLARKNSGTARRRDDGRGYKHTGYAGGVGNNDSRDNDTNNNDSHTSDSSSSGDSGGSGGGSDGGGGGGGGSD